MTHEWIMRSDGALCLSGYPIRIKKVPDGYGFKLTSDWHKHSVVLRSLASCKQFADDWVADIDAFSMPDVQVDQFTEA